MRYIILFPLLLATTLSAKPIAPPEFDTPQTRLFYFSFSGNIEGIDAALEEGADLNSAKTIKYLPLNISILLEDHKGFDRLLKRGADIHLFNELF